MAGFSFNIAKGRAVQFYHNVQGNSPTNSALLLVAISTSATDDTLRDLTTLAAVLANADTDEATNTGYARKLITDASLSAAAIDHTNNWTDLDFPDQLWVEILAGTNWTDVLVCYVPDSTSMTDATTIPMTCHDFIVTPDGRDIPLEVNAEGFYRATGT